MIDIHNKSFWSEIKDNKFTWGLLFVIVIIIFFVNLGAGGLPSAQEGRAGIVARNMLETGNWEHIIYYGAITTEKPILCYWFYAVSGLILGGINEFSVRVPSAIAAIITVIISCHMAFRIYGRKTAILSGYVLSTMTLFVNLGHIARIDIILCAFYTALMSLMYFGYFKDFKANKLLYIFYPLLGVSILVKGPVSAGLIGITVLVIVAIKRNPRIIWDMKPITGAVITLAIAAPWFIIENIRTGGAFSWDFFINQNLTRLTGIDMTYKDGKRGSFFYYFPKLFVSALPWSIFVPFALVSYFKKLKNLRWETYYFVIWFFVVFIFFTLAAIKRGDYIVPLLPALAVLIARYIDLLIEKAPKLSKIWIPFFAGIAVLFAAALTLIKLGVLHYFGVLGSEDKLQFVARRDGKAMVAISDFITGNFIFAIIGILVILALFYYFGKLLEKGKIQKVFCYVIALSVIGVVFYYVYFIPATCGHDTLKFFCADADKIIPPNASVFTGNDEELIYYLRRNYSCGQGTDGGKSLVDDTTHAINFKYWICEPKGFDSSPQWLKDKFELKLETPPGHNNAKALYVEK